MLSKISKQAGKALYLLNCSHMLSDMVKLITTKHVSKW